MVDAGLPVPAHTYVLKSSHAFNVLDARGAVSTSDRAAEFGRMRRLAGEVSQLWMARREELGHPLGVVPPTPAATAPAQTEASAGSRQLVFEIGTEEMPPAEARTAREQVRRELTERLAGTRLAHGEIRVLATPRRLIAIVDGVADREQDHVRTVRGPKVSAAYDAAGEPTPAVRGFARGQGVDVADLQEQDVNGTAHVTVVKHEAGRPAAEVLADVLSKVVTALRSAKNMRWNDPALSFTRPVRWLLALRGDEVVPFAVSALAAGRETRVHRKAASPVVTVNSAETHLDTLAAHGIVADPDERRAQIVAAAERLASAAGGQVDVDGERALIDQISYLVETPTPLLGRFDESYLRLPEAVLANVMRKHQRYLPVRGADGGLLPCFVAVANGDIDEDLVRAGNEAVLRARYEDAAFFYRADRDTPLDAMRDRLERLTFTDKLGSMADRAARISTLARTLASSIGLSGAERDTLGRAAELVKFDLGAQLVTEMTSLAGVMARDYAAHAGEPAAVAEAIFESELPRNTGDAVPTHVPGALLSLADRLDLVTGLAATVGLPTGSSDPFAVRRAVLGLLAVHRTGLVPVSLTDALAEAAALQPVEVAPKVLADAGEFLTRRLEQVLVEEGHPIDRVRAVLPHAARPALADRLLHQLDELVKDERFRALVEAIQRARRIVPAGTPAEYDAAALVEPAERRLDEVVRGIEVPGPDLTAFLAVAGKVTEPVNTFFDEVFVMAEEPELRKARLGLLATVRDLGDGILDWDHLRM
jgi:glycyl-tRNA synthetase